MLFNGTVLLLACITDRKTLENDVILFDLSRSWKRNMRANIFLLSQACDICHYFMAELKIDHLSFSINT